MELVDIVRQAAPFLERWLEHHRAFTRTPGVQVAVRVGDELCASFALGTSNLDTGEPLTTSHLFHIASHSKTFTATACMQLVEAGRLRLDDRVGDWVDGLAGAPVAEATIRELLGHQGGVNRDGADADHWQLEHDFPDAAGVIELARADAVFAPNEHFKYSNIGYSLLGQVVEAASGQPYESYVLDHIVRPPGLVDTGPEVPAERVGDLAGAHGRWVHPDEPPRVLADTPSRAEAAATGFYSTAEEVSRYLACHAFGRDELVSDASKRLMQRRESRILRGGERFYGLGMIVREVGGRDLVGHSGGWPGHITMTWLDPTTGLVVSVLTNRLGAPATAMALAVVNLLDMVIEAEKAGAASVPEGIDPNTFTGCFSNLWGQTEVVLLGTRLYALGHESLDPRADASILEVVDADTLRAAPEDSFLATGEPWLYTRDADGKVTSVRQGGMTSWPHDEWLARR